MTVLKINNDYLLALSKAKAFKWMLSLEPLRAEAHKLSSRSCCGGRASIQTHLHPAIFEAVIAHPKFAEEINKLKHEQKLTSVFITAANKNVSL